MGTMARAARSGYDTDLTEVQWALVEPFVRAAYSGLGPYHRVSRRAVVDAILYQNRTGCQWRLLPRDLPNGHTVRHYYDTWRADGTWEALNALVRAQAGKEPTPSTPWVLLIVDSQSARTTEMGGEVGVDGGKKVKGRKRQLAVDSTRARVPGLLWRVRVHAANVADCVGGWLLLEDCVGRFGRLVKVLADSAYGRGDLWERVRDELGVPGLLGTPSPQAPSQALAKIISFQPNCPVAPQVNYYGASLTIIMANISRAGGGAYSGQIAGEHC